MLIIRNALLIVIFLSQLSLVFSQPSDYDLNTNYSINDMVIREQTTYFSLIDNNKGIQPPDVNSWISLEDYFNQLGYEQPLSTWSALTSYNKDDAVSHDGAMYFALVDNINIEPPATNAWTTGSPSGTSNIWEINSTYNVGDIVFHNEVMYVAINQNTGNEPPNISHWSSANDNTTPVSSPLIDPLASGLLSSTNEAFIRQQYVDFFGRKADTAGINYYNEKFVNGYTKAELVDEFVFSTEFQDKIAPVSRLYLAYFLRIPDTAGLEYWINEKLNGLSLEAISSSFAGSTEFNNRYGALNNADFIRLVYQNIFGRSADVAGFNYYLNLLDSGNLSRGAMMTSISESTENKATSLSEVRIISFYYGMLRRTPEQGGYDFWVAALDAGTEPKTLLDDFINSAEYQARF
jgi:hypothetical protein